MNTRSYIVSGIMGVAFLLVVSACTSESTSSLFGRSWAKRRKTRSSVNLRADTA